jgi:glutaredoxin
MKKITIFKQTYCGYCQRALQYLEEIRATHPEYKNIDITLIDERDQFKLAQKFDYYYVPTFYIENEKVHEGAVSFEQVRDILERALEA